MSIANRHINTMGKTMGSQEHVSPSNHPPASRLPVMANIYHSNEHFYAKRAAAMPVPVNFALDKTGRVNKFTANHSIDKRSVCDTYTATDRNHSKPPGMNPYMMENGINNKEKQRDRDYGHSEGRLAVYNNKTTT
jgi:hypothetical protein